MASEGKHTAGPWEQDGLTVRSSRGIIAKCPVPQDGGTFDCQDNARLITGAPETKAQRDELLAALEMMVADSLDLSRNHVSDLSLNTALNAIAKAKGEPK